MGWYEYSCCGRTFTRWNRYAETPILCPRCSRPVLPFARCQAKANQPGPSPE